MDQTTLAQRDALASEYQLGRLEMQRTPRTLKGWVLYFGCILAGVCLIWLIAVTSTGASVVESFHQPATLEFAIIAIGICALLVIPAINYSFKSYTVYLYTHGLVYLNRSRREAARWEEIERVIFRDFYSSETGATLDVYLKDGTSISVLPHNASRASASLSALDKFIRKRMKLAASSGGG